MQGTPTASRVGPGACAAPAWIVWASSAESLVRREKGHGAMSGADAVIIGCSCNHIKFVGAHQGDRFLPRLSACQVDFITAAETAFTEHVRPSPRHTRQQAATALKARRRALPTPDSDGGMRDARWKPLASERRERAGLSAPSADAPTSPAIDCKGAGPPLQASGVASVQCEPRSETHDDGNPRLVRT